MTTTFYLLRTENAAVGDGPYFGVDDAGAVSLFPTIANADRFETIEAAEEQAKNLNEKFGKVEIEVRNSISE